uniref:(northern house mosquito) hypothetical protein n=1 Tax=Culex pipiens TaxID=7175 RepID=A0A8D8CR01_CULPI
MRWCCSRCSTVRNDFLHSGHWRRLVMLNAEGKISMLNRSLRLVAEDGIDRFFLLVLLLLLAGGSGNRRLVAIVAGKLPLSSDCPWLRCGGFCLLICRNRLASAQFWACSRTAWEERKMRQQYGHWMDSVLPGSFGSEPPVGGSSGSDDSGAVVVSSSSSSSELSRISIDSMVWLIGTRLLTPGRCCCWGGSWVWVMWTR